MSMRLFVRWEGDSEELLERHARAFTEALQPWHDEYEEALLVFHSGNVGVEFPDFGIDALFTFVTDVEECWKTGEETLNWVHAEDMRAAAERLLEGLRRRTPEAREVLLRFVADSIWEAEHKKARFANRKCDLRVENVDLRGRPTEEDWAYLLHVIQGFKVQIEHAMALGADRITIEYD
jgi:hypothetical protein